MNTKKSVNDIFEVGKQYSVYAIDSMMAMTHKKEILITGTHTDGNPIFKKRGKRKQFIFELRARSYQSAPLIETVSAIFEGWDQPVSCDTESHGTMRGNALYNFTASPETIRAWIEAGQLNPNFEAGAVLSVPVSGDSIHDETPVFPELYQGGHAVMDRILDKVGA